MMEKLLITSHQCAQISAYRKKFKTFNQKTKAKKKKKKFVENATFIVIEASVCVCLLFPLILIDK